MLAAKNYVPLLKSRISEIEAYHFLSHDVKDRTFPVFLLRPWPNANNLSHAVDKILGAMGGRPFGLGLDRDRLGHTSAKQAQVDFDQLFNDQRGFEFYFDFLDEIESAVPVLQGSRDVNNLLLQLGRAEDLDRGLIVHQQRGSITPLSDTILGLPPLPQDTLFIVDAAWGRDVLQMQAWTLPTAQRIVTALPNAEVVIMASSFPDSFSHIVGTSEEASHEVAVFDSIRQQLQEADLTYGDWGSTRLPQSGGGGRIPPRVDVPRAASWQIFRADPSSADSYLDIAVEAQAHRSFSLAPDCWGKLQIAATDGNGAGISGTKMNTSSRINIHMTTHSGSSSTIDLDDEPFND